MEEIDKESQQFIEWAMTQDLNDIALEVIGYIREYYGNHLRTDLKDKLKKKMIAGAKEHGKPKVDISDIKKEINCEAIDLIGWFLMKKYTEKAKKEKERLAEVLKERKAPGAIGEKTGGKW